MKLGLNIPSANALREYAKKLPEAIDSITENTSKLLGVYKSVSNSLGEHEQAFHDMLKLVQKAQKNAVDAMSILPEKMINCAEEIEQYVNHCLGVSATSGDESNLSLASFNHKSSSNDDIEQIWNEKYITIVKANIRQSVKNLFSDYISNEKLESSLDSLTFTSQKGLRLEYGTDFEEGILGFNDGESSIIASDIKASTMGARVGEHYVSGSGQIDVNFAFVTAVHENLHMMSSNDTPMGTNRGIMVGGDEYSRAMNEAFTEYFTYLSCGGDNPLGGLYPGAYSSYQILMQEMPTIEKAVGRDCMMDAYFNNKPQRIQEAIDKILGNGAWNDICKASYDVMYNNNLNGASKKLIDYFDRLQHGSSFDFDKIKENSRVTSTVSTNCENKELSVEKVSSLLASSLPVGWCVSNSMKAVHVDESGQKVVTIKINGVENDYRCTKSGMEKAYNYAKEYDDDEMIARTSAMYEIETLREMLELGSGEEGYTQLGGYHKDVRTQDPVGYESHHIPSQGVQLGDGQSLPTVSISHEDHKLTSSYTGKQKKVFHPYFPSDIPLTTYKESIAQNLDKGGVGYVDSIAHELLDLRRATGHRYDGGVSAYLDAVIDMISTRGIPKANINDKKHG